MASQGFGVVGLFLWYAVIESTPKTAGWVLQFYFGSVTVDQKKKLPQSRYVRASVCKNKLGISSNQRLYGTKPGGNFPPVVVRIQRMEGLCRCYLHLHRVHHERTRDSDHEGSSVPTEAVKGWLLFVNIISPLYRNQLSHHDQHCFIVTGICI